MNIRKLFLLSNKEIIAKIFKILPREYGCFCPYIGTRLIPFTYNVFDNGLAYEKYKDEIDFNRFSQQGNKILCEASIDVDNLIHILVIRLGTGERPLFDHKESEFNVIANINEHIKPNNTFLKHFGMIGNTFPIISYENNNNIEESAVGFVIYRNLKEIEKAISHGLNYGHGEAEKNYGKLVKIARRKKRRLEFA